MVKSDSSVTRYTLRYRPPSSVTLPRGLGWTLVERPSRADAGFGGRTDLPLSQHPFGVFVTDRALTADELVRFEIDLVAVCIQCGAALPSPQHHQGALYCSEACVRAWASTPKAVR